MNLRVARELEVEGKATAKLEMALPKAIRYAIRHGARVIVCTVEALDPAEKHFGTSLEEAEKAGVLFVQAAGNQGLTIDTSKSFSHANVSEFLSGYSNVLIVGGTTRDGGLSPRMNFGKRVGIAAPCVELVGLSWDGYERLKGPGTSFAAPIVAAVAATLLSQEPKLTPAQVIARLREASVVVPGMKDVIGGGRLDMAKLFRQK
jgi:subtilisin family serine protease